MKVEQLGITLVLLGPSSLQAWIILLLIFFKEVVFFFFAPNVTDIDMLENVEIGEQKQRDDAYKAAKKKTGIYVDKYVDYNCNV